MFWDEDFAEGEEEEDSEVEVDIRKIVQNKFEVDLRKMVNNADLSDVTFLCEDGVPVHGCRILLAARSSHFKTLLLGKMAESTKSSIHLPTVSSFVLITVMKFMYTGKLLPEDFDLCAGGKSGYLPLPVDWNFLLRILLAAQFFMLENLGQVITERLKGDIPERNSFREITLERVATIFSALCDYPTLWATDVKDNSIRAIYQAQLHALSSQDLSQSALACLSKIAFHTYLEETQRFCYRGIHGSRLIDEYLRIRQILIWCIVSGEQGKGDIDVTCLPGPEVTMDYIDSLTGSKVMDESRRAEFDFTRGRTSFVSCIDKKKMKPWLKFLDFTSVRAELLHNIVEPLGILKPADLSKVYRGQARRLSRQVRDPEVNVANVWHVLAHENTRRLPSKDEYTLTLTARREAQSFEGVAIAGLAMTRVQHVCKWEFSVAPRGSLEGQNTVKFEFGFIGLKLGETFPRDLKRSLSSDVRCSAVRIGAGCWKASVYCEGRSVEKWFLPVCTGSDLKFQWTTPLQVTLNDGKLGSCTLRYAGEEVRFSFRIPKGEIVYPALSFTTGTLSVKPHYDQFSVKIQNFVGLDKRALRNPVLQPHP